MARVFLAVGSSSSETHAGQYRFSSAQLSEWSSGFKKFAVTPPKRRGRKLAMRIRLMPRVGRALTCEFLNINFVVRVPVST
jgi:hypothetical protein